MVEKLPNNFKFNPVVLDQSPAEKRRIVRQLPGINQTETLQKFFGATVDHLFNPGQAQPVNGYVGHYPVWYNPKQDHYVEEKDRARSFYQLESTMVSRNNDGEIDSILFYPDLVNQLRFQGANVLNHNRLFEQEFYTWCPPVDLDKIINFRQYYWVAEGPEAHVVIGPNDTYNGDGQTSEFSLPHLINLFSSDFYNPVLVDPTMIRVKVDSFDYSFDDTLNSDNSFKYNVNERTVTLNPVPAIDAKVTVWVNSDFDQYVVGRDKNTFNAGATGGVELSSNTRILITNDLNPTYNGKHFIVENMGEGIVLIPDVLGDTDPEYLTIARGCQDGNPWSKMNRWFHKSTIKLDNLDNLTKNVATRPIVEFQRDLKLFNYGTHRRYDVDLVATGVNNVVASVHGLPEALVSLDGVDLDIQYVLDHTTDTETPSIRILITNDANEAINNKIYLVTILNGNLRMSLETEGQNPTGDPEVGEIIKIKDGDRFGNKELHWDGVTWKVAQPKSGHQFPLFDLFDANGVTLSDQEIYPNSTFQGSRLFTYQENISGSRAIDPVLKFRVVHDKTGQFVFENHLATKTYQFGYGSDVADISGFYYTKKTATETSEEKLSNDWYRSTYMSRQMMVDRFLVKDQKSFKLSQEPAEVSDLTPDSLIVTRGRLDQDGNYQNNTLERFADFFIAENTIAIPDAMEGDIIEVKTYNPATPVNAHGFYEVPLNLQANPNYDEIAFLAKGDYYVQFADIIRNQPDFKGAEYDVNNWKDSVQERFRGIHIVQHSASLLKTMLMASNTELDLMNASRFVETEYSRFRAKFEQKIGEFINNGRFSSTDSIDKWVNTALEEINRGKTSSFPFYYSGVGQTTNHPLPTYIPATPSFIGVHPLFVPGQVNDYTLDTPTAFIQGHDGSMTLPYGDIRDLCILNLEKRIYNSAPVSVRTTERPLFDTMEWVSGKFRDSSYTYQEYLDILQPSFERWTATTAVDYRSNDSFDAADMMTWNWSSVEDTLTGELLRGHWRGIYQYFFDTDRPHTHPWEMLGFNDRPSWWTQRYGPAPYTRNNHTLWNDLENGFIFAGPRRGINARYARPGLSNIIPVGPSGKLLDPFNAGIAKNQPTMSRARANWVWGDGSPVEALWRRSSAFAFASSQTGYLMKPAMFVEIGWDTKNLTRIFQGSDNEQYINSITRHRTKSSEVFVHGEQIDGKTVTNVGIQQWVADSLINKNASVTDRFGSMIRGMTTNLAYKLGGFTDIDTLTVVSDSFDRVPDEDISVHLYRSPSIREEFYGGMIVEWTGDEWKVFGYDVLRPYFNIIAPDVNGTAISITSGSTPRKIHTWKPMVHYTVGTVIRFNDDFFEANKTHTSAREFEAGYWNMLDGRPTGTEDQFAWYLEGNIDSTVTKVSYGSSFKYLQDVVDVMNGYERYLSEQGWKFDHSANGIDINDWQAAAKKLLVWQNEARNFGDFIALSPLSERVRYESDHGTIQSTEQIINGVYAINDRLGNPIETHLTNVVRGDNDIVITHAAGSNGIFGVRLYVSEIEHVMVFNNQTIFNDTIYNPLLNIKQPRLRVQGYRSENWKGRVDAPGFIVTDNRIVPNFERAADDFRRIFDIEGLENKTLQDRARANIGYQERDHLNELMMTSTNQFEFYQGMVQEKGTHAVLKKLLRNNFIRNNKEIKFFEEWAFRTGDYGASEMLPSLELTLQQKEFQNNPQLIEFETMRVTDLNDFETAWEDGFENWLIQAGTNMKYYEVWPLPKGVDLVELRIEVYKAFDGNNAVVSVGDSRGTQSLLKNTTINDVFAYEVDFTRNPVSYENNESIRIYLSPNAANGKVKVTGRYRTHPQRFFDLADDNPNDSVLSIKDIFSNDSQTHLFKDPRWVVRHPEVEIKWPSRVFKSRERGFLPNAGFVNLDDVKWFARDNNDFDSLLNYSLEDKPNKLITRSIDFSYDGISTLSETIQRIELIPNNAKGFYRIRSITLDVSEAFVEGSATVRVGSATSAGEYLDTSNLLNYAEKHVSYPFELVDNASGNSAVYVEYEHAGLPPLGVNIGKVKVTVEVEHLVNGILPGDRAWNYDTGAGDWMTYRISDTGTNAVKILKPSHDEQASIVCLNDQIPERLTTSHDIIIAGVGDKMNNNYRIKTNGQARLTVTGSENKSIKIMDLIPDAGMVIDRITMNLVTPFTGGKNSATISVGTTSDDEMFVNRYTPIDNPELYVNPTATRPVFSHGQPISIEVFDANLVVPEGNSTVEVEVVRSGNIFVQPSSIVISNPGQGYTSAPDVLINGPEGVKATAKLSGGIANVNIVNGGEGYTSAPIIDIIGDGQGAILEAVIEDGRVIDVNVINSGYGYTRAPQIVFRHTYGEDATAEAVMLYGVDSVRIEDIGKCNFSGVTPATITFSGGGVEPGVHGSHAVASVITTPTVAPSSSTKWRYREAGTNAWVVPANNTLTFPGSHQPGASGKDHWLQTIILPVPTSVSKATVFEIQLYDATNAVIGENVYTVKVANTAVDNRSISLNQSGTTIIEGLSAYTDESLEVFLDAQGNTGLLTVVVDYHYENGFELTNRAGELVVVDQDFEGGDLWVWENSRFYADAHKTFEPIVPFKAGDKVENDGASWTVEQFDGVNWNVIRQRQEKVDSSQITKAAIYNSRTNNIEQVLQLYDPYKGFIPGVADRELHFKLPYDPAGYNAGNESFDVSDITWGADQVGMLWWDLSTVRYVDYESDSIEYRWKNWGKLAPRTSVDIYEWVESKDHPAVWSGDGELIAESRLGWVETTRWNSSVQTEEVIYYFWVKNVSTPSFRQDRELTARQVANVIKDPMNNDIPYFSVIDSTRVIVGGIKQFLTDEDTVLKINWTVENNDGNHHKQWMLMREGDNRDTIDPRQWNRMVTSIVGWDDYKELRESDELKLALPFDINSETMTLVDASTLLPSGELSMNGYWFTYSWKSGNVLHDIVNSTGRIFPIGSTLKQKIYVPAPRLVPDPMLTKQEALGNMIRPRQSWFAAENKRPSRQARKILVESINDILSKQPFADVWYDWRAVFEAEDLQPSEHLYSHLAPDMNYRNALIDENQVRVGQRILLTDTETAHGFWTLWRYDPSNPFSDDKGLVMEDAQRWRMRENEMWQFKDWYAEGWSPSDFPNYRFATKAERDAANIIDETLLKGTLVQIDRQDDNDPRWSWSVYTNGGWTLVAMQNGTIELKDHFYREGTTVYGFDNLEVSEIMNRDGSHELNWLLDHFYNGLFNKGQVNNLFFDMVKAAFAFNQKIDWAFKTSFLYLGGYAEKLEQRPVSFKDQITNVIKYIEEVKPYHVKIRDYVRRLAAGPDISRWKVTDFDKPVYNDAGQYRTLRFNPADEAIMSDQYPWKDWYDNYKNGNLDLTRWDANWNPVRRTKVRILFDRTASVSVSGWDSPHVPWDSNQDHYKGTFDQQRSIDFLDPCHDRPADWADTELCPSDLADMVVRTIDERNNLVRNRLIGPHTLVSVLRDDTQWVWDGVNWNQVWAVGWDTDWASSMIDRVNQHYNPKGGQKRKEFNELLDGVDFRETTAIGEPFDTGIYDAYGWDFEGGWDNERPTAVGIDVNIKGPDFMEVGYKEYVYDMATFDYDLVHIPNMIADVNPFYDHIPDGEVDDEDYINGYYDLQNILYGRPYEWDESEAVYDEANDEWSGVVKIRVLNTTREKAYPTVDIDGDGLVEIPMHEPQHLETIETEDDMNIRYDLYGPADIALDGGKYVQPHVDSDHTDELVKVQSRSPVTITIVEKKPTGEGEDQDYIIRLHKSSENEWDGFEGFDSQISLMTDLTNDFKNGDDVVVVQNDEFYRPSMIFDPHDFEHDRHSQLLYIIKTNHRNEWTSEEHQIKQAIVENLPTTIWINNERITFDSFEFEHISEIREGVIPDVSEGVLVEPHKIIYTLKNAHRGTLQTTEAAPEVSSIFRVDPTSVLNNSIDLTSIKTIRKCFHKYRTIGFEHTAGSACHEDNLTADLKWNGEVNNLHITLVMQRLLDSYDAVANPVPRPKDYEYVNVPLYLGRDYLISDKTVTFTFDPSTFVKTMKGVEFEVGYINIRTVEKSWNDNTLVAHKAGDLVLDGSMGPIYHMLKDNDKWDWH